MIAVNYSGTYVLEHKRILKADSMFPGSQGSGIVEQTTDMKDFKPSSAGTSMFVLILASFGHVAFYVQQTVLQFRDTSATAS